MHHYVDAGRPIRLPCIKNSVHLVSDLFCGQFQATGSDPMLHRLLLIVIEIVKLMLKGDVIKDCAKHLEIIFHRRNEVLYQTSVEENK